VNFHPPDVGLLSDAVSPQCAAVLLLEAVVDLSPSVAGLLPDARLLPDAGQHDVHILADLQLLPLRLDLLLSDEQLLLSDFQLLQKVGLLLLLLLSERGKDETFFEASHFLLIIINNYHLL
jgi:hypothetical protein